MATPPGKVPILESAKVGFDFMRANLPAIGPAAALGALLLVTFSLWNATPAGSLLLVLLIAFGVAFRAFTFRLALGQQSGGPLGLKLGREEFNLFAASMVIGFFMVIVAVMGFVLFAFVLSIAAAQAGVTQDQLQGDEAEMRAAVLAILQSPQATPALAVPVLVALGMAYLSARLALAGPATIGERKLMAFSTWRWTEGNGLRILAACFLVIAPLGFALLFVVNIIAGLVAAATGVTAATGPSVLVLGVVAFVFGLGVYGVILPALSGVTAHLYKGLRPVELPPQA
jgi:hypothetical protein